MNDDHFDEQRVCESMLSKIEIGIVWRVNVTRGRMYAWSHVDEQKSPGLYTTRTDAIEGLRTYHKSLTSLAISRPSMDQSLMRMAKIMADRATCSRAQVGAVIVLETRPVSSGYNGVASGLKHCDHSCDCVADTFIPTHAPECRTRKPCEFSVHAEANAIAFAAKHGVSTKGATLYTTMAPCLACAKLIVNAGIVRVVAAVSYRDDAGIRLLFSLGIPVDAELLD